MTDRTKNQTPKTRERTVEMLKTEQLRARSKIQAGQLIGYAARIASGEDKGHPAKQTARLAAIRLLLAKSLPDLQSIEMQAQVDGSLTITINKVA